MRAPNICILSGSVIFQILKFPRLTRWPLPGAAYNAGPAKVRKMRSLALKMGLDQNRWFNNVEVAAGKIVGVETVRYVSNIYKYYVAYQLMGKEDEKNMAYN